MQNRILVICFTFFLLLGAFLRFGHLDWGRPYFFHPDENNITTAIAGLSQHQWNPHFFAYGSLPIYTTYFSSLLVSSEKQPSFALIAYTLRFFSALLSFLLIPSLLFIGTKLFSRRTGFIAGILASVGTGFIQFAHFGTFEMWLTFFSLWFFYATYLYWKKNSWKTIIFAGIIGGILLGIKISSLVLLPIPLIFIIFQLKKSHYLLYHGVMYLVLVTVIYFMTNPFSIIDPTSVLNSLHYESSVALGTSRVFYTQSFLHTQPILFQALYVFPFLLNPLVFLAFLFSLFSIIKKGILKMGAANILLLTFFFVIFLSQAFFFVKWTRYMVPCLPFIYLIIGGYGQQFKKLLYITLFLLTGVSTFYSFLFFSTVYQEDSRITASNFSRNLSNKAAIIEPYDLGIVPFLKTIPRQTTVNIYDIEDSPFDKSILQTDLAQADIFVSLSQRLIHTRLTHPKDFPEGNKLYKTLFNKKKYIIIYQTPCNAWCAILYNGNPYYNVEETATVFDHPFVTIFQKI